MIKAIGWDDRPQDYLTPLAKDLKPEIELQVHDDEHRFLRALDDGGWRFVVADIFDRKHRTFGVTAANRYDKRYPFFLITDQWQEVPDLSVPPSTVVCSKQTDRLWTAHAIKEHLRLRGLMYESNKVLIVYGTYGRSSGSVATVRDWLTASGCEAVLLDSERAQTVIFEDLLKIIDECCAAIAICTPDDAVVDRHQPRPNVMVEIGMVLGRHQTNERLTIIRWTGEPWAADLPSDLQGPFWLDVPGNDISFCFDGLGRRLLRQGVALKL